MAYIGLDILGITIDRGIPRLIGLTFDPNFYVMFNAPFFFLSLETNKSRGQRFLLLLSATTIFLSFSRGGWLAIFVALAFRFFLKLFLKKRASLYENESIKKRILKFFSIAIVGLLAIAWTWATLIEILTKRFTGITSGSGRADLLDTMYKLFSENPFVGIGFHNFRYYNLQETGKFFYGHNTYMELLVEVGVIGVFFYFLFFISFLLLNVNLIFNDRKFSFLLYSLISIQASSLFLTALLNSSLLFLLICSTIAHKIVKRVEN